MPIKLARSRLREKGIEAAERGEYFAALRLWDTVLRLDPSDYKLWELKAQVFMEIGEDRKAEVAALESIKIEGQYHFSHLTLTRALRNLGEVQLAVSALKKALAIQPEDSDLLEEMDELNELTQQAQLAIPNSQDKAEHLLPKDEDEAVDILDE